MEQSPKFLTLTGENLSSLKSANQKIKSDLESLFRLKSWKMNASVQTDFDGTGIVIYRVCHGFRLTS